MKRNPNLIVKFCGSGDPSVRMEKLRMVLGQYDVDDVGQLFPDEVEEELAALYTVNLAEETQVESAKQTLMEDEDVEYAHVPQARGSIRG